MVLVLAIVPAQAESVVENLSHFDHIIVIDLENHSFDNLYGAFPGADNVDKAALTEVQVSSDGLPYKYLPPILDTAKTPPVPDDRFPANLPNQPFIGNRYVGLNQVSSDPVHRFYQEQAQIDGGKMDRFVLSGNSAACR